MFIIKSTVSKQVTHDHRRIYPQVYGIKEGATLIQRIPTLKYVSQEMNTSFDMNWIGHPEPTDDQWVGWKVVNQLKQQTKDELNYKFKLMPYETVWHSHTENHWHVSQMMQVPDIIATEMFELALNRVRKNMKNDLLDLSLVEIPETLCAHKLHIGHYNDTYKTFEKICEYVNQEGYTVKGSRREIYLTPSMKCHQPETWKTIVRVEIENKNQ